MTDYVLDLAEYSVRAALLLFLCRDNILLKEKYRSYGKVLFFLQAFLVSFWLSNSVWVNRLIYGEENIMNNSSYTIVKLVFMFLCSFVSMDILYQGRRFPKIYLLSVFYTVQEMIRFMLHSAYSLGTTTYLNRISSRVIAGDIDAEQYYKLLEHMQLCAMLAFSVGTWLLMYIVFKLCRRYLTGLVTDLNREGVRFLMLVPVIGLAFDVLWRITFYYQRGTQIEFLYEKHAACILSFPQ